jgi:putative hemolysin
MLTFLELLAVLGLVLANGFFVATEFSLVSARRTRIEQLARDGNKAALAVQRALERLDSYIASTQLGITLASLALGWIGEPVVADIFHPLLNFLPVELHDTLGRGIASVLAFALMTTFQIIIGELVPKTIALQRPEATAMFVARPVWLFRFMFGPIVFVMKSIANWIVRLIGLEPPSNHAAVHSPEELEMLVKSSREAGLIGESDERLLRRAFDFGDLQIKEVMRPRTEVDAVWIDTPLPDLLRMISSLHYSRYPVYHDTVDTVTGILHTKDLLDTIGKRPELLAGDIQGFSLGGILRTPLFVPTTTDVDRVLDQMQRSKTQMAIVLDEYGGMAGIATMEDIVEELIGEVEDEFDEDANPTGAPQDLSVVDGLLPFTVAAERYGEPEGKVMSTTLGGYVAERLDRIPVVGDVVPFGAYDMRVEAMDGMRAARVRFIKRVNQELHAVNKPANKAGNKSD